MDKLRAVFGHPIYKEYEVGRQVASGGPGCLWRIHEGTQRSRKEPVAVFVFDKKALMADKSLTKQQKEDLITILRRGPTQPLLESKDMMAFATEPLRLSMANQLGRTENLAGERPTPMELHDIEVAIGMLQIAEALAFCHNDAALVCASLSPDGIYIGANGDWKLGDFHFSYSPNAGDSPPHFVFGESDVPRTSVARGLTPDLGYVAPELVLQQSCIPANDVWSFAMLMVATFSKGTELIDCNNNLASYRSGLERINRLQPYEMSSVPDGLRDLFKLMLHLNAAARPGAADTMRVPYFDNIQLLTLRYIDSLVQKDDVSKAQFMKGLPKVVPTLPRSLLMSKVLPALFSECKHTLMVPFVLPNILLIAEDCSAPEFERHVFPGLIPLFPITEPVQVLQTFLHKMEFLLTKTPPNQVSQHVLPMVYRALEGDNAVVHQLAMSVVPSFMHIVEYGVMKDQIIPRVQALCIATTTPSVRINGLVCLGKLLPVMDKWMFHELMMPFLEHVPAQDPGTLMGILGIFTMAMQEKKFGFDAVMVASRVIPYIAPLCVSPCLNGTQFGRFMKLLRDMMAFVEEAHSAKLRTVDEMNREASSPITFTSPHEASEDAFSRTERHVSSGSGSGGTFDIRAATAAAAALEQEEKERAASEAAAQAFGGANPFAKPAAVSAPAASVSDPFFGGGSPFVSSSKPGAASASAAAARPAADPFFGGSSSLFTSSGPTPAPAAVDFFSSAAKPAAPAAPAALAPQADPFFSSAAKPAAPQADPFFSSAAKPAAPQADPFFSAAATSPFLSGGGSPFAASPASTASSVAAGNPFNRGGSVPPAPATSSDPFQEIRDSKPKPATSQLRPTVSGGVFDNPAPPPSSSFSGGGSVFDTPSGDRFGAFAAAQPQAPSSFGSVFAASQDDGGFGAFSSGNTGGGSVFDPRPNPAVPQQQPAWQQPQASFMMQTPAAMTQQAPWQQPQQQQQQQQSWQQPQQPQRQQAPPMMAGSGGMQHPGMIMGGMTMMQPQPPQPQPQQRAPAQSQNLLDLLG